MDEIEVWQAIRAVLIGDAPFVALLADPEAVYESSPAVSLRSGTVTIQMLAENPELELSAVGLWRPRWQINFYHTDQLVCQAAKIGLDRLLTVPRIRRQPINSAHYSIVELNRTDGRVLGPVRMVQPDLRLWQLATDWTSCVRARS